MSECEPDERPLVSVIVPAFNASATIARTLNSIRQQTYTKIEIIVVDDGSNDDTCKIVSRFAESDSRIRLIRKANGGVASARNAGIKAATGEFVAPIDADDLWHPTRVAQHVTALVSAPAEVGLVYSPCRRIDEHDRVVGSSYLFRIAGWVLFRHLYINIVGNGSGITARHQVIAAAGGYQSWLRDVGAEGCEDFLLQLTIAMSHRFTIVPEFLIGYREVSGRMSADPVRMMRSQVLAVEEVIKRCHTLPLSTICLVRLKHRTDLLIQLLRSARYREVFRELDAVRKKDLLIVLLLPLFAITLVAHSCRWLLYRAWEVIKGRREATNAAKRLRVASSNNLRHFFELRPHEQSSLRLSPTTRGVLAVLGIFDRWCSGANGYQAQPGCHRARWSLLK